MRLSLAAADRMHSLLAEQNCNQGALTHTAFGENRWITDLIIGLTRLSSLYRTDRELSSRYLTVCYASTILRYSAVLEVTTVQLVTDTTQRCIYTGVNDPHVSRVIT